MNECKQIIKEGLRNYEELSLNLCGCASQGRSDGGPWDDGDWWDVGDRGDVLKGEIAAALEGFSDWNFLGAPRNDELTGTSCKDGDRWDVGDRGTF